MCILIDGREDFGGVPLESNISSSAAFEESAIYAIEALVGVRGKLTAGEAIEIGREAEAKIGFPCGKLDQGSSIVTREITPTGKIMGAAIDCVPRLDEAGRDKTVIIPFEIPAELQAVLVNSGPKGDAQREYNIRVLEGELASWILARFLNELSPDFAQDPDKIRAAVAGLYSDINPDHNGKPYLYDKDRVYPVFLKPAFFAGNRLRELDVDITDEEVIAWVKRMFPDGITMQELFDNFSLPKEFFDLAAAACKKINIPVESMSFNLRGTALHAITEEQRAPLIMQALKDAVEAQTDEAKIAALKRFGELQREGYESLRDNYRNSTPDIDRLVGWAGQQPWSLSVGSDRHFGAGWGGWVEVWVMPDMVDIAQRALTEHLEAPPRDLMPYEPGAPASIFAQVAAADEPMTAEEAANNKDGPKPAAAAAAGVADVGEAIAAFKALREAIAAERAGNYTAGLTAATDAAYENFRVIYARDILPHYTPADAEITYHPGGIKLALSTERNSALSQYSTVRIVQSWQDETDVALRYRANVIYKVAIESVRLAAAKCPTEGLSVLEYATIPENSIVAVPGVLFTGELAVADVFMLPEIMGKFRASNTRLVIGGLSDAQKEVLTAWVGEESVTQGWVIFDNAINNSGASVPAVALLGIAQKYGVDENNVYDFVPIKPGYKAVNPEFYSIVDLTPLVRQFTLPEEGQYLSLSKLFNEAFVMQGNPEALINAILPALPEGLAEPLEELRKTIREAAAIGASV
jgi:galactokinase